MILWRLIFWLLLYHISCDAVIFVCQLDLYMPDISSRLHLLLVEIVTLVSWAIALIGAIRTIPPAKPGEPKTFSIRKVFHFAAAYGGFSGCCRSVIAIAEMVSEQLAA